MKHGLTAKVKSAVQKLFLRDSAAIEERILRATGFARAHQDILALSFGDRAKLEELCLRCEDDVSGERNIYSLEEHPEEYLTHIMRKDDAAAEVARRFEYLEFDEIWQFASWGQWSTNWKKEWSNQPLQPTAQAAVADLER